MHIGYSIKLELITNSARLTVIPVITVITVASVMQQLCLFDFRIRIACLKEKEPLGRGDQTA